LSIPNSNNRTDSGLAERITLCTISGFFERVKKINLQKITDSQSFNSHKFTEEIVKTARDNAITTLEKVKDLKALESALKEVDRYLDNFTNFMAQRLDFLIEEDRLDLFLPKHFNDVYKTEIGDFPFGGRVDAIFQDNLISPGSLRLVFWKFDKKKGTKENAEKIRHAARSLPIYNSAECTQINEFYIIYLWHPVKYPASRVTIAESMLEAEEWNIQRLKEIARVIQQFEQPQILHNCLLCNHNKQCEDSKGAIDLSRGCLT